MTEINMSVARITEISASSTKSFEDAVRNGVARSCKTLKNVTSAWVADQQVVVKDGEVTQYVVKMKVTFVLE
jgi:dodecin